MCEPFKGSKPLRGAALEALSAVSSLNMYPERIVDAHPESMFLSEIDANAKHSVEHSRQAVQYAKEAEEKVEAIKWRMFQMLKADEIKPEAFDKLYTMLQELA